MVQPEKGGSGHTAPAVPAGAVSDPYEDDPLRLVPFADSVQHVYTDGSDVWEVWICRVPGWTVDVDLADTVANLSAIITPYFQWVSAGAYQPVFRAGGEVTSEDNIPTNPQQQDGLMAPLCQQAVSEATSGTANAALIVVAAGFNEGAGTAGAVCPEPPFSGCTTTYPQNFRYALVAAGTVTATPPQIPQWGVVAHEMGHALNWPHSYGGLNLLPGGNRIDQYDNPMDVMSGGALGAVPVGAIAYHRYAAGWIDPVRVVVHRAGTATYTLTANAGAGIQMIVIPIENERHFYVLGARRNVLYDATLPATGVEVYEVDQRSTVCNMPTGWPSHWPCFATLVRIAQNPAVQGTDGTAHVLAVGTTQALGDVRVTVDAANSNGFTVQVLADRPGFRFVDDDGNPHEANIEAIADLGITRGCNPPLGDRFCPAQTVTRAEMAAFLIRAMGEEANLPPFRGYFPDVSRGEWYTPYVERLYEVGVTTGFQDGSYRPAAPVSRAEMSVFLVRAFGLSGGLQPAIGLFADVPPDAWYASHAELIYRQGITRGCVADPLGYCPTVGVHRDEMASFQARALGVPQG